MTQPFYASSAINRHGNYRNNAKILNQIIIEKDTKFIPFYNGKNLFTEISNNIKPVILDRTQLNDFFPNGIDIEVSGTIIKLKKTKPNLYVGSMAGLEFIVKT